MPRHRSFKLKKFIESIPETLIAEYFNKRLIRLMDDVPI